jgi:hypothetical protein
VDGLLRGDFKSRMEGHARSIQAGIRTPNEARLLENMPAHDNPAADQLFIQGATVPLNDDPAPEPAETQPEPGDTPPNDDEGGADEP